MHLRKKNIPVLIILAVILLLSPAELFCLPEGHQIESGNAAFNQPDASSLEITVDDKTVINFNTFNIAADESVTFIQPSASATVLSRVRGNAPSSILGSLTANGILFLTNPQGIKFASSSQVKVNSLIASSLEISTNNFINGNYIFERTTNPAYVFNEGIIEGDNIAFIGSAVSNIGLIQATAGTVHLASGDKTTLTIDSTGLIQVEINEETSAQVYDENGVSLKDAIANLGTIEATQVFMDAKVASDIFEHAINQNGIVKATGLVEENGIIKLVANDNIALSNTLEAQANTQVESTKDIHIDAPLTLTGDTYLQADENIQVNADIKISSGDLNILADANNDGIGEFQQLSGIIQNTGSGNILIDGSGALTLNQLIAKSGLIQVGSRRTPEIITSSRTIDGFLTIEEEGQLFTYINTDDPGIENTQSVTIQLGITVIANELEIISKQIGTLEVPLKLQANHIRITRTTGDIDILESIGIGSSIMLRGPPDGFGAIIYPDSSSLSLQAASGAVTLSVDTLFKAENITLQAKKDINLNGAVIAAGTIYLLAEGYVTNNGLLEFTTLIEKSYHFTTTGPIIGEVVYVDDVDGGGDYGGPIGADINEAGDINLTSDVTLTADNLTFTAGNDGSGAFISNGFTVNSNGGTNYNLTISVADNSSLGAIGDTQALTNLILDGVGAATPVFTMVGDIILIGDLTLSQGSLDTSNGATGYDISVGGDLIMNGGNLDASDDDTDLAITGSVTVTTGTLSAPTALDDTSFTVGGNWEISGDATFTTNNGRVVFNAGDGDNTITTNSSNNDYFYDVRFENAAGTWTLQDDLYATNGLIMQAGTLNVGAGYAIGSAVTLVPTLTINGGLITAAANNVIIYATDITHSAGSITTTGSGNITSFSNSATPGDFTLFTITSAGSVSIGGIGAAPNTVVVNGVITTPILQSISIAANSAITQNANITASTTGGLVLFAPDADDDGGVVTFTRNAGTVTAQVVSFQFSNMSTADFTLNGINKAGSGTVYIGTSPTNVPASVSITGTVTTAASIYFYSSGDITQNANITTALGIVYFLPDTDNSGGAVNFTRLAGTVTGSFVSLASLAADLTVAGINASTAQLTISAASLNITAPVSCSGAIAIASDGSITQSANISNTAGNISLAAEGAGSTLSNISSAAALSLNYDTASATYTADNCTITGQLTIDSNVTLALGGADTTLDTNNSFTNSGTLELEGDEILTDFANDTANNGTVRYTGTGVYTAAAGGLIAGDSYYNLIIQSSSAGSWQLDAALDVLNDLMVNAGTIDCNNQNLDIGNYFVITTSGQTIGSGSGLNGSTITVNGDLDWSGEAGDLLDLAATAPWFLNVAGTATAHYANVAFSDANGGVEINGLDNCIDLGGNLNWLFAFVDADALIETFKTDGVSNFFSWFVGQAHASEGDMMQFVMPAAAGTSAPTGVAGQGQRYGFDDKKLPGAGTNKYSKPYLPGDYQTTVEVTEGRVAVSDYDNSGPKTEGEIILNAGDRTVVEGTISEREESHIKIKVTIIVPPHSRGEFMVIPYDKAGRHEDEAVIVKPGDTYTEIKEID
jgi:filamentous hemagglutinin family protein